MAETIDASTLFKEPAVDPSNPLGIPASLPLAEDALRKAAIGTQDAAGLFRPGAKQDFLKVLSGGANELSGTAGWVARNQGNLKLDAMDEPSAAVALMAALRGNKREVMDYAIKKFKPGNVREDTNGDPIIKVTDPNTGEQKEMPLNAHKITANDLVHLLGKAGPEALGFFLGTKAVGGLGKEGVISKGIQFLKELTAGSVGQETVGGIKDTLIQGIDKANPEYNAIAIQHLANLPLDIAMGYALKGAGEAIPAVADALQGKMANPLGGLRNADLQAVSEARTRIAQQTGAAPADVPKELDKSNLDVFGKKLINMLTGGTEFPMNQQIAPTVDSKKAIETTLAEATGMPLFSKMMEYIKRTPAGAKALLEQESRIAENKRAAMAYMVSPSTLKTDEEIGREALGMMKSEVQTANKNVSETVQAGVSSLEKNIKGMGNFSDVPQSFGPVGESLQTKVVASRDAAKAEQSVMRDEISQIEGATGKAFPSGPIGLQENAVKLRKSLPAPNKTVTELQQTVDSYGNPTETPVTKSGQVIEKQFVPPHVVERLNELAQKKDYSLSDLIQMRTSVYEDISAGQAVPNTGTHYLNGIGKMLTEAIDKGIARLPEGSALKSAVVKANTQFKENVLPFNETGVHDLFKPVSEGGMETQQIVRRLMGDASKYARTVQIVGKGGEEHLALQQAVRNQLYHDSISDPIGGTLDASKFVRNMTALRADHPEIYKDVFGRSADAMITQAEFKSFLGKIPSGQLPIADVEKLLSESPKISKAFADQVKDIAGAYRKQQELYKNEIFKNFVNGTDGSETVKADDVVSKLLPVSNISDLTQFMAKISGNQDLSDQISRKLLFNLFVKSARPSRALDVIRKAQGEQGIVASGRGLLDAIGSVEDQKKLEIALGPDRMNFLRDSMISESGTDWQAETAGLAGMLAGGQKTGAFLNDFPSTKGFAKDAVDFLRFKLLAIMISNTPLRKVLTSTHSPEQIPGLTKAIVMSEPFVKAIVEDSAPEDSIKILGMFKRATGIIQDQGKKVIGSVMNSQSSTNATASINGKQSAEQLFKP